jgi:hypothetical protein
MRRIGIGAVVAAAISLGVAFEAGRVIGPRGALAQEEATAPPTPQHDHHKLPQPYDVRVILKPEAYKVLESHFPEIVASGVETWDTETVGGYTLLRLSVSSGKLWYFPMENVSFIEATPFHK